MMFHIPPYWWYSMQFNIDTTVTSFKYKTIMNTVSIIPLLFIHLLQSFNIKRKFMKTFFSKNVAKTVKIDSKLLKASPINNETTVEKKTSSESGVKKEKNINKTLNSKILPNSIIKPALNSDTLSPQLITKNKKKEKVHSTNIKQTSPVNETVQVL